jgi:hypothetical protein
MEYTLNYISPAMYLLPGSPNVPDPGASAQRVRFAIDQQGYPKVGGETYNQPDAVWAFVDDPTGYKCLMNMKYGTYLRAYGSGTGGLIMEGLWAAAIEAYQWKILPELNGSSVLQNKLDGRYLSIKQNGGVFQGVELVAGGNIKLDANGKVTNGNAECFWIISQPTGVGFSVPRLDLISKRALTYWIDVSTPPQGIYPADVPSQIAYAIRDWMNAFGQFALSAPVTVTPASQGQPADLTFRWGTLSQPGEAGVTPGGSGSGDLYSRPPGGLTITFKKDLLWIAAPPPGMGFPGQYHLRSVVAHELGHAFGLDHNPDQNSVMQPTIPDSTIRTDDTHPICYSDVQRLRARYIDLN